MKNALLAGASGMIGSIILRELLSDKNIRQVVSLVRRPSKTSHEKMIEIVHEDFTDLSGLEGYFTDVDVAFFCIGQYTGSVPDGLFKKITVDMAAVFGDTLKANSPSARLCFLSGQGADRKEKSRMAFAKYKGMAENHLLSLGLGGLHIFRPAYIYPVHRRKEPNASYRLMRTLYPIFKKAIPHVTSEQLGKAMFTVGLYGHELDTLENRDINSLSVV